ncbi:MAG: hypothetical protein AB7T31_18325 [Gemmatimonadales bacterium]
MSDVKSALTPEEWAPVLRNDLHRVELAREIMRCTLANERCPVPAEGEVTHALAALCLHGQPFGFTREDVRLLRQSARDERAGVTADNRPHPDVATAYDSLADRIEALLPPEGA